MAPLRPLLLAAALTTPAAAQTLHAEREAALDQQDWGWVMAISGVVTAAAGGSMLIYGHGERERLRWQPTPNSAARQTADDWHRTGAATLGLGAALLTGGVLLWVFDTEHSWHLGGAPTPSGATVGFSARF